MMRKSLYRLFAGALVIALAFMGCGKKEQTPEPQVSAPNASGTPASPPVEAGTSLATPPAAGGSKPAEKK